MRIQIESKVSLILILMAGASLVSMLATLNIDHIINHDLYSYGLQFSTKWAYPYWTMAATVFSMGWLIIVTSIAFELHLVIHRFHKHPEPETQIVHEKMVQSETPQVEAQPTEKPQEQIAETTAIENEPKTAVNEDELKTTANDNEVKATAVKNDSKTTAAEDEVKTATTQDEVKATALAVKTQDDLSEFRVLLQEISAMTDSQIKRQKTDDGQTTK